MMHARSNATRRRTPAEGRRFSMCGADSLDVEVFKRRCQLSVYECGRIRVHTAYFVCVAIDVVLAQLAQFCINSSNWAHHPTKNFVASLILRWLLGRLGLGVGPRLDRLVGPPAGFLRGLM